MNNVEMPNPANQAAQKLVDTVDFANSIGTIDTSLKPDQLQVSYELMSKSISRMTTDKLSPDGKRADMYEIIDLHKEGNPMYKLTTASARVDHKDGVPQATDIVTYRGDVEIKEDDSGEKSFDHDGLFSGPVEVIRQRLDPASGEMVRSEGVVTKLTGERAKRAREIIAGRVQPKIAELVLARAQDKISQYSEKMAQS